MSEGEMKTMSIQTHAAEKITAIKAEIKVISRWFAKTHGGPEIYESDLAEMEPETRSITQAMMDRRQTLGKELHDWEKHI